ncbi:SDR family NAD(P)-dependent oxidoreductase [Allohahella marinimesophila]|uniref:SDR family oxidoreductase n=1 Tax=Allohahella marinimesophila TaxID=1054972 RepID=A0ABP7NS73_9GAMM
MSYSSDSDLHLPPLSWTDGPINVVLTGSTGGIGSAMLRTLLTAPDEVIARIFTIDRSLARADTTVNDERLLRLEADFTEQTSFAQVAERMSGQVSQVHLVINCIGLLHAEDIKPEKSLRQVALPQLHALFAANAYPVLMLAQALEGLLKHKGSSAFVSLSARVGSLTDNRTGGWYGYRASKAAHNMFLKTLSLEWRVKLPHCICVALHPGTVKTGLSKPFVTAGYRKTLHSPEAAAGNLLARIGELTLDDSGSFIAWDGERLPW